MPSINLELQLKFLNELDEALKDALGRYSDEGAEKLAELEYMQREVLRARRIIAERVSTEGKEPARGRVAKSYKDEAFREVAFS